MDSRKLLDTLNAASAAAAEMGEQAVFGIFPYDGKVSFTARIECEGTGIGIHASSDRGWGAALAKAHADRADFLTKQEEDRRRAEQDRIDLEAYRASQRKLAA